MEKTKVVVKRTAGGGPRIVRGRRIKVVTCKPRPGDAE